MSGWEQIGIRWRVSALLAIVGCSADGSSQSDRPAFAGGEQAPGSSTGAAPSPGAEPMPPAAPAASPGEPAAPTATGAAEVPAGVPTSPPGAEASSSEASNSEPNGPPAADMSPPSDMPTAPVPPTFSSDRADFGLGGDSLCGTGQLAICESFESAALGSAAPSGFTTDGYGNRTLTVVEDDSARGRRSLRIDVAGGQGAVVGMLVRSDLGALGARHFGRSFMKVEAPAPTGFVHWDAFEGRGNFGGQANFVRWASTGTNVGTTPSNWSWIYNVQSTDHGEFGTEGSRSAHPVDGSWMCLEWLIDSNNQEARFFQDGSEVPDLHIDTERSEIPVFDDVRFGFQKFQQSAAFRVWVDELAVDGERIGCNR